jgi:hypothetical protein
MAEDQAARLAGRAALAVIANVAISPPPRRVGMSKGKIWGFGSLLVVLVEQFFHKAVESWFFDKVVHEMNPYESVALQFAIAYGPMIGFVAIGVYLLGHGTWWRKTATASSGVAANAPTTNGHAYLTPRQAVQYLADQSEWGTNPAVAHSSVALLRASQEFRDRASEGRIRAYGISPESHEHEEISKTHWMSFGFAELKLLRDEDDGGSTEMKDFHGGFYNKPGYSAIRIVAEDVYTAWPRRQS